MEKERIVFIDYLRVVACFLVMLVHASENFYGADSSGLAGNVSLLATEQNRFWVAFFDGGVARTCVPLFMIASAFLLAPLKPGQGMGAFYRHRFLRILPPMLCFMLIYTFLPLAWGAMTWEQSLQDLRTIPFNFPSMAGHLWFMYPLILHRLVAPELWGECFWNEYHALWYCSGYLGYLVLAHYIRVHLRWDRDKRLRLGALCFLVGAAFTAWSFWWRGTPGELIQTPLLEWSWEFTTPNVVLATFGAFLLFSCIEQKQAPRWITETSKLTFGMYLMHLLFLAPISNAIISGDVAHPLLPVWLAIPVIAILSYLCCLLTTKLLTYLPGSKWIVGA